MNQSSFSEFISDLTNEYYFIYIFSPVATFIAGVIIALLVYYNVGKRHGIKTPVIYSKIGRLHLPLYLSIIIYLVLLFFTAWTITVKNETGIGVVTTENLTGLACFNYTNPLLYIWLADIAACIAVVIIDFAKKKNFWTAYLLIGISFLLFSFMTLLSMQNYVNVHYGDFTVYPNPSGALLGGAAGVIYIVCAAVLAILNRNKKAVDKQPRN